MYYIETDFLFVKPVAAPGPAEGGAPALGFFYPNIYPEHSPWKVGGAHDPIRVIQCSALVAWPHQAAALARGGGGAGRPTPHKSFPRQCSNQCNKQTPNPNPNPKQDLLIRKVYPPGLGPLSEVPRTGPSPVLMRIADWIRVIPRWEGLATQVGGRGTLPCRYCGGWLVGQLVVECAGRREAAPAAASGRGRSTAVRRPGLSPSAFIPHIAAATD